VTLDNEPKTTRSKRSVPVARSVMRRLEQHLSEFVDPNADALVFTAPAGGPLFRSWGPTVLRPAVLRPAVLRAGLDDITFHGLRHSFVAIMVAADCNGAGSPSGLGTTASRSRWRGTADCLMTAPVPLSIGSIRFLGIPRRLPESRALASRRVTECWTVD
jgi:integrase